MRRVGERATQSERLTRWDFRETLEQNSTMHNRAQNSYSADSGSLVGLASGTRNISTTAATVSSRASARISEDDSPQTTRQNLLVGPSKSQCDAPWRNVERSSLGTACAIEPPLP